jgi:hypothetical protein
MSKVKVYSYREYLFIICIVFIVNIIFISNSYSQIIMPDPKIIDPGFYGIADMSRFKHNNSKKINSNACQQKRLLNPRYYRKSKLQRCRSQVKT